ncbi:MAG: tryptophan synthase subunit alpha [Chloroflexi bacterium]|nr:tryptophan synthase subunit alpha [Chloroflexota bacterium]
MDRLKQSFDALAQKGTMGIIPYLTVGFPSVKDTLSLVPALVEGGADVIELGVPFSDPLADGPTIQRASFHALAQGVTLGTCLQVCQHLRSDGVTTPLVLMGYYNPILSYRLDRFAVDAQGAGVDGVIVPDLPFEEAGPLQAPCSQRGIQLIPLLAPTSTDTRIACSCEKAGGFVYCISLTGVTGARQELPPGIPALAQRVRSHTDLPLAIGFGISQRHHVEALAPWAQAAVVGSALIEVVERTPDGQREEAVKEFVARLKGTVTIHQRRQ